MKRNCDFSLKIVVIGESAVGKTSFLIRYVRDTFDEETQATLGIEFFSKIIQKDANRIQLQLWDTAGQELFRTVTRGYYRGAAGALVLFDLANRDSFDGVGRWIDDVKSVARHDVVLILIGNKSDLETRRQVSRLEAADFAERYGMHYFEASARTGTNVCEAVNACVSLIENVLKAGGMHPEPETVVVKRQQTENSDCC